MWASRVAVLVGSAAVGALISWLLIGRDEASPPMWAVLQAGIVLGGGAAISVWLIRRWRTRLGALTAAAAVGLGWAAALTTAVFIPSECPTDSDLVAGRCSLAEASTYTATGIMAVTLLMLIAAPFLVGRRAWRLRRTVHTLIAERLNPRTSNDADGGGVAATKRTNSGRKDTRKR